MAKVVANVYSDLIQIFKCSVSAVLPSNLIKKSLKYNTATHQLSVLGCNYNLKNKNVYVIGFGKAVQNMAVEVENLLDSKIKQGIVSVPIGIRSNKTCSKILYHEGAKNNLPDRRAESTATEIKKLVTKLGLDDFVLVLISGGGSALLPLAKKPITLEEKTMLIQTLANSGADIKELNVVRKKISELKGGKLAIHAQPAQVVSLILSDIVGDPLDLIASGPTTENNDHPLAALKIIYKYNLFDILPESIKCVLNEKTGGNPFPRDNVQNFIIGSNHISTTAALAKARDLNYVPLDLSNTVTGNVNTVAEEYGKLTKYFCNYLRTHDNNNLETSLKTLNIPGLKLDRLQDLKNSTSNLCLIFGGEITVKILGSGKGGRNQELALKYSHIINEIRDQLDGFDVSFLSAGTDGIDGPTDAAGAIGYLNLISDCNKENINHIKYLSNNDSYSFFKTFNNGNLHVVTGHTNTNVMDIHLIIIKRI